MTRLTLPAAGTEKLVADLPAAAAAAALGELAGQRCVLAVLASEAAARRLHRQAALLHKPSHLIAGWEMLPYDVASPPRSAVCARSAALSCLRQGQPGIYAVSAASLMLPVPPPEFFFVGGGSLAVGQKVDMAELRARFLASGCIAVERVRGPGEFAVCGGQIDVYPAGHDRPCRLVFDDDSIEQIRIFDPASQRSCSRLERFDLLAARDYPLDDVTISNFRQAWRENIADGADERIYEDISAGREAQGVEFLLPLFYGGRYSALDYLRPADAIWMGKGIDQALEEFAQLIEERYHEAQRASRAALPPAQVFADRDCLASACGRVPVFNHDRQGDDCGYACLPDIAVRAADRNVHSRLLRWLREFSGPVIFALRDFARREEIRTALAAAGRSAVPIASPAEAGPAGTYICDLPLVGGFVDRTANLALVTESELYNWQHEEPESAAAAAAAFEELMELSPGDLVVTPQHGVGRFLGLRTLVDGQRSQEFVAIEYAKQARLYVAVASCHEVSRYRQPEPDEEVALDSLGGQRWSRVRRRAAAAAQDTAVALLQIYARRAAAGERPPLAIDERAYAAFCARFPHPETACQTRICAEVLGDMSARLPMDRLLCGDVGFGKTEVAIRAAWAAWHNNRQVIVLAPTTLLAEQHFRSFAERFAGSGAELLLVAGRTAGARRAQALARLASGDRLIAIGTHALLAARVSIPRLGLAIIDEENRFGVRQKERVKQLRSRVDVLAMSATPIPRSLSMAMEGLRDLSLMATAPAGRIAVRSFVAGDEDGIVREALARELARGGQAFYLHHRISTIDSAAERVRFLAPSAKVAVVHARLPVDELEAAMRGFYRGEIDVLVCSIVIQSGIDVANANTILVPHADRYGLAQLHQLRGRVGRSGRQAYAYFLAALGCLKDSARRRLHTVAETSRLGGGHMIAMRDLEIRGAGELLGVAQSGAVTDVGIEAFRSMVKRAVRIGRGERALEDTTVDLDGAVCLPDEYCPSPVERMRIYNRLSAAASAAEIERLRELLLDRFGRLPLAAQLLLRSHLLRISASRLGISAIKPAPGGMKLVFGANPPAVSELIELVGRRADLRLRPDSSLIVACESRDAPAAAAACGQLLDDLARIASIVRAAAAG